MRIVATIEARMTSTRLPGKVLLPCLGRPMLDLMIERLRRVPELDDIVIATTTNQADDPIEQLCHDLSVSVWRGSEDNVMERVLQAAQNFNADVIVELTGDCPLIDPAIVQHCIHAWLDSGSDYLANCLVRSYPIGMDTQVFWTKTLADAFSRTTDLNDLEHVSLFIYRHPELYKLTEVEASKEHTDPELRLTLDTQDDYRLISTIFLELYPLNPAFTLDDILKLLSQKPELRSLNSHVKHRYV